MSRINPYSQRLPVYQPGGPQAPGRSQPGGPLDQTPASAAAAPAARPPAPGLNKAEQSMIDAYFPPQPASLQLYSPGPGPTTLTPGALGTRLDVTG